MNLPTRTCTLLRSALPAIAMAVALVLAAPIADAQSKSKSRSGAASGMVMYRWIDDDGVTRVGQFLPADQAGKAHEVLNDRGIVLRSVPADPVLTDPATREAAAAERRAAEQHAVQVARRDAMLLNAYLSVEDIEALRDRRLEMMDSQIQVTENYLQELRERLARLEREAQRYQPYNEDPTAPPIDEKLAAELSDTLSSIMLYEQNLAEARERQEDLAREFAGTSIASGTSPPGSEVRPRPGCAGVRTGAGRARRQ